MYVKGDEGSLSQTQLEVCVLMLCKETSAITKLLGLGHTDEHMAAWSRPYHCCSAFHLVLDHIP